MKKRSQVEILGKRILSPNGSRTHDLPDTGWMLNRYLEGHGFDSRWGLRKFFFRVFWLENASSSLMMIIFIQDDPVGVINTDGVMSLPSAQTLTTQSRDYRTNHEATTPPQRPENLCSRVCSCCIEFSFHVYRMLNIKVHQHNLPSQRPQSHQVHSACQYTPGEMLVLQVRYWFN